MQQPMGGGDEGVIEQLFLQISTLEQQVNTLTSENEQLKKERDQIKDCIQTEGPSAELIELRKKNAELDIAFKNLYASIQAE